LKNASTNGLCPATSGNPHIANNTNTKILICQFDLIQHGEALDYKSLWLHWGVVTLSDGAAAGLRIGFDPRFECEVAGEIERVVIVRPEVLSHAVEGEASADLSGEVRSAAKSRREMLSVIHVSEKRHTADRGP